MATQTLLPRRNGSAPSGPATPKFTLADITGKGPNLPNRLILHATEGWGKCLGKGTPVLMFDGSIKPVQDIQEGDILMGPDSEPRVVRGLHNGYGPLYRVTPTKGEPYVVNWKHVLSLKMSQPGKGFHRIVNMSVDEYLKQSDAFKRDALGWRAAVDWPEQSVPLDPYLLGVWLGDGTSSKPDITTPEPEIVSAMKEYAAANSLAVVERADAGKAKTLSFSAGRSGGTLPNSFTEGLKEIGVLNDKHIPWEYMANSREVRLALLAGILDTDGYLYENVFEIIQKNLELADNITFVARSLGLAAYVSECQKSCPTASGVFVGTYYRVKISGDTDMIPTRVPRKVAAPRKQRKSVLVTGITVEPIGDGEFYGFEVDRDHLFLLGDFTVTHNTSFAAMAPSPIVLQTRGETGLETLIDAGQLPETPHFPTAEDWLSLLGQVDFLVSEEHPFRTLVIDTLNGAERLCHEHTCATEYGGDWGEKGFMGFQRGYDTSLAPWRDLLSKLDRLRAERRMSIILLAHTQVKNFKNPEGSDYDRYETKMHQKTWALSKEWSDIVLFGHYRTAVIGKGGKEDIDPTKRGKARGGTDRILLTQRTAAWDAKNRLGLPEEIDLGYSPREAWTAFVTAAKEAKEKGQANG